MTKPTTEEVTAARTFCLAHFKQSHRAFGLSCAQDFAPENGMSVAEFGNPAIDDPQWFVDTMRDHGLDAWIETGDIRTPSVRIYGLTIPASSAPLP